MQLATGLIPTGHGPQLQSGPNQLQFSPVAGFFGFLGPDF